MTEATNPDRNGLEKSEVLILDRDKEAREASAEILSAAGVIVTSSGDSQRALRLAGNKFFQVILIDGDTPEDGGGFKMVGDFQKASPASSMMMITSDRTFETAVRGFRAGAADVVAKVPDNEQQLLASVENLCLEMHRTDRRTLILQEALEVHEEFLRLLIEEFRKARVAEESVSGLSDARGVTSCKIMVVDDNPRTAPGLLDALGGEGEQFGCVAALNGGEALDYAGSMGFDIALIKQTLPDLAGSMVARTLKAQSKDSVVLIFAHPDKEPGFVSILEEERQIDLIPELRSPGQLVKRIRELRDAYIMKAREKKYLHAFRKEHIDFLRRYMEYRKKMVNVLPGEDQ